MKHVLFLLFSSECDWVLGYGHVARIKCKKKIFSWNSTHNRDRLLLVSLLAMCCVILFKLEIIMPYLNFVLIRKKEIKTTNNKNKFVKIHSKRWTMSNFRTPERTVNISCLCVTETFDRLKRTTVKWNIQRQRQKNLLMLTPTAATMVAAT